jgi:hypothetical protein
VPFSFLTTPKQKIENIKQFAKLQEAFTAKAE